MSKTTGLPSVLAGSRHARAAVSSSPAVPPGFSFGIRERLPGGSDDSRPPALAAYPTSAITCAARARSASA